ncbi:MAG: hypothetical protein FD143_3152 [Ignavibacteria bacterium]|nr:MAG: hypothetical protein FD143_3152 [Ignavibacteria bacterium]KAF0154267.1 MAG: hypothetical protein FD188_3279 [Ignavibacteria bacterium]
MKKIFVLLLLCSACNWNVDYFNKSYEIGQELKSNIGASMIYVDEGVYNKPNNIIAKGSRIELVYSGREGNVIKVMYREYFYRLGALYIKDGFTQNLQYNLSDGNEIVFQNKKFRVIEANNQFIRFIVLE